MSDGRALAVRVDGNEEIGSGHLARCCAIADELEGAGCEALFFVSDERSKKRLELKGRSAFVVGGDCKAFGCKDARVLADALRSYASISGLLVDSYGVTPDFMDAMHESCIERSMRLGYIDDLFRYDTGFQTAPCPIASDLVINYGFGVSREEYERVYAGYDIEICVSPMFAPVRREFRRTSRLEPEIVESVLVTSGTTNPYKVLERMAECCCEVFQDAEIHVVVGFGASFEKDRPTLQGCTIHYNPTDMSGLMQEADLVVSAAGTTLYELAALGIPTLPVPITDNQLANVSGWEKLGLGPVLRSVDWSDEELRGVVRRLSDSRSLRECCSTRMASIVDGNGALRIADALIR